MRAVIAEVVRTRERCPQNAVFFLNLAVIDKSFAISFVSIFSPFFLLYRGLTSPFVMSKSIVLFFAFVCLLFYVSCCVFFTPRYCNEVCSAFVFTDTGGEARNRHTGKTDKRGKENSRRSGM